MYIIILNGGLHYWHRMYKQFTIKKNEWMNECKTLIGEYCPENNVLMEK